MASVPIMMLYIYLRLSKFPSVTANRKLKLLIFREFKPYNIILNTTVITKVYSDIDY